MICMKINNEASKLVLYNIIAVFLLFVVVSIFKRAAYMEMQMYHRVYDVSGGITAIQYKETREQYGVGDGKKSCVKIYTYVYPDKLRIENLGDEKVVEIYNHDKYIYHEISKDRIRIKECFPPDKPYITEMEKRMKDISGMGNFESFGYEERDNIRLEVIGIRWKDNEKRYMRKFWIGEINGIKMPFMEEYFIDNRVVSKVSYVFLKVNEPISPEAFQIEPALKNKIIQDGVIPRYVESFEEARRYLDFIILLPKNVPEGLVISEIAVIPPSKNPSFHCIYFKESCRIYLDERTDGENFDTNTRLGNIQCFFTKNDEKIILKWEQKGVIITINGDVELEDDIMQLFQEISGEKLVRNE